MGVASILFQYGSEVAYPIQEGTSLGVMYERIKAVNQQGFSLN